MKKRSKHFRKDVIIARIIFLVLCIVLVVLISLGITALKGIGNENTAETTEELQTTESNIPETEPETEPQTEAVETITYAKTKANVRMRVEPNTNCDVITSVPTGTKTLLLEEAGDWYKVSYNGREGYIRGDYIEIVEE